MNKTDNSSTKFEPQELYRALTHDELLGPQWRPIYEHECDFDADGFFEVVHFLVRNPNINSSNLFRADLLYDSDETESIDVALSNLTPEQLKAECPKLDLQLPAGRLYRRVIRRFVPRNDGLDKPINQSVFYYKNVVREDNLMNVVVMIPHVHDASQMPFYHPSVAGLAFTHHSNKKHSGISLSYHSFADSDQEFSNRQLRTALHLLKTTWKHGQGNLAGYKKRMHHDQIIPQKRVQDRFANLKKKYAAKLIANWVEVTDPAKQVFEQIGIAAFLLELWTDMYSAPEDSSGKPPFPGFVDIGCGNGVLDEILISEGYHGWGIEGHRRKTWSTLSTKTQKSLIHGIVVPAPLDCIAHPDQVSPDFCTSNNPSPDLSEDAKTIKSKLRLLSTKLFNGDGKRLKNVASLPPFHNGIFNLAPDVYEGPFLISNHADELTGWTPLLALLNRSSFFIVPCCSRNLSGERFRAPSHGNNWTADQAAPTYFQVQGTANQEKKKHIAIHVPIQTSNLDESHLVEELVDSLDLDRLSRTSSNATESAMLRSASDDEQKYHFINAAPLAVPPSVARSAKPEPNGQAAESGDLKKLSQKARSKTLSGYQALCCWVVYLADKCGFLVEREMLRLPSTRNFGIIGRFVKGELKLRIPVDDMKPDPPSTLNERMDKVLEIIAEEGGASRSKWVGVCETEIVKGNDCFEHGT